MSSVQNDESSANWHLDKRIPIATLLAILGQAVALGWMASSMDGRLVVVERYADDLKAERLAERIAVEEAATKAMDLRMVHVDGQLDRLEDKIDKIADRVGAK